MAVESRNRYTVYGCNSDLTDNIGKSPSHGPLTPVPEQPLDSPWAGPFWSQALLFPFSLTHTQWIEHSGSVTRSQQIYKLVLVLAQEFM